MRLKTLLLADHATVDESGKINVNGGGITRITTALLPAPLPFISLVAQFVLDDEDFSSQFRFQVRIRDGDGEEVAVFAEETMGPLQRKSAPFEDQNATVIAQIGGVTLLGPGRYMFEVYVDGDLAGGLGVAVYERQPERP